VPLRHSQYPRADHDFYVEPAWVLPLLLRHLELTQFHDPCCGLGTLVTAARQQGVAATGADIVDRAFDVYPVRDFLADTATYPNIVTNPPYAKAAKIIAHGLNHVADGGYVAVLVPLTFLASCRRYELFTRPQMALVLILSKRPSMPPGETLLEHGERIRGNGTTDFAWLVWQRGRTAGAPSIIWIRP
jgi:SAM-dependent methyltransferase